MMSPSSHSSRLTPYTSFPSHFSTCLLLLAYLQRPHLKPLLADSSASWSRKVLYTERFLPNGPGPWTEQHVAVRGKRFKWMEVRKEGEETETYLFDLRGRIDDGPNLLDGQLDDLAKAARKELKQALAEYEQIPYAVSKSVR